MKKIYNQLQNPNVQGTIIVSCIILALAIVTLLTWGK